LVAPNPYKGTLSAASAAAALAAGLGRAGFVARRLPLADGGPGTLAALRAALGGRLRRVRVEGPLGAPRMAAWLDLPGGLAVVESAEAIGLQRVPAARRDAMAAGTAGLGQLLLAVAAAGKRRVLVGLGGSASTDGGSGMARVLGWRFLDAAGAALAPGGGPLAGLARVRRPRRRALGGLRMEALCDVAAPLHGPHGAARAYGPQKGATPAQVRALDAGLRRLAALTAPGLGLAPGAGAAGGLGFGLQAFAGARLRPGAEALMDGCGLEAALAKADLLVTGEGCLDAQSLQGKLPAVLAGRARAMGKPCVAVVGRCALSERAWRRAGFSAVLVAPGGDAVSAAKALERAAAGIRWDELTG
jgi:glycerate kinase